MGDILPKKGIANGEPTYEGICEPDRAAGWWQGEEAWLNLTWGGTMGVFYGVAALWQWKRTRDEPGWPEWAQDGHAWHDAIHLAGSTYVGYVSKALAGFDFVDMEKHPELAEDQPCVARPGVFYCVYLPDGGQVHLTGLIGPLPIFWFSPKTGIIQEAGRLDTGVICTAPNNEPWVLLAGWRLVPIETTIPQCQCWRE